MLDTANARIDVFKKKIPLEVEGEKEKVKRTSDDDGSPQPMPIIEIPKEPRTFVEKVKSRIAEEQENILL
nr:hypothetical protein [Tanacetum cinerariifolium]